MLAVCWAALIIPPGANQAAQFAEVVGLAHGSPSIDAERNWTGDIAYLGGHFYAAKAPGLPLATVPWYLLLDRLGLVQPTPPRNVPFPRAQETLSRIDLWEVALWGSVLPSLVLLFLVRGVADRMVAGYGTLAAVALGAAGTLAVMSTMFFDHALSACLGFAAFACLFHERRGRSRPILVAFAGLFAGLAVTTEFPLAIVAVALGAYALLPAPRPGRAFSYAGGVAAGLVPLALFNAWAFGSPFTLAYSAAVAVPGKTGHDVLGQNSGGLFGVGLPRPHALVELLFSGEGLVVLAPVWAAAGVGLVALWRSGFRREASLVAVLAAGFLAYNAGYKDIFGGMTTGPRFLVPLLPFLALPLAAAWRRAPATTSGLCLVSALVTWVTIVANPMGNAEDPGTFFNRLLRGGEPGEPLSSTVFHWIWPGGNVAELLAVMVGVAAALALAARTASWRLRPREVAFAAAALMAWRVLYVAGPTLLSYDKATGASSGAAATVIVVAALAGTLIALARGHIRVATPGLVLLPLLWARVDGKPFAAAGLGLASVLGLLALSAVRSA